MRSLREDSKAYHRRQQHKVNVVVNLNVLIPLVLLVSRMRDRGLPSALVVPSLYTQREIRSAGHRVSRPRGTGSVGDSVGEGTHAYTIHK